MRERYRVGVLGATGVVGQRLVARLQDHPWFELRAVAASERSAGRSYGEAVGRWRPAAPLSDGASQMTVVACDPDALSGCDVLFSALDSGIGRELERRLAAAGRAVVSNCSAHRMAADVPLVIPEVNPEHVEAVRRRAEASEGFIVTNPNCSICGLVVALAPLHRAFGVRTVVVATMQALSGAGTTGPRALDMTDNVLPFIPGEEDKFEGETRKLLGGLGDEGWVDAPIRLSAHCHRVNVLDGHLEAVSVGLDRTASVEDAKRVWRDDPGLLSEVELPSRPERAVIVTEEPDRPQPRLDRDVGGGMTAVVGRVRDCPVHDLRFEVLVHNAERGAAGAAVLNGELLAARGLLPRRGRS